MTVAHNYQLKIQDYSGGTSQTALSQAARNAHHTWKKSIQSLN